MVRFILFCWGSVGVLLSLQFGVYRGHSSLKYLGVVFVVMQDVSYCFMFCIFMYVIERVSSKSIGQVTNR